MSTEQRYIRCTPFTAVNRLQPHIGKVWGWDRWPLPMTVFQLSAFVGTAVGLLLGWHAWGRFGMLNFPIYAGAVAGSKYATRRIQVGGRAIWAAALGLAGSYTGKPRMDGRKFKARQLTRYKERRMLLVPDPQWRRYPLAFVTTHGHRPRVRFCYWVKAKP